MVEPLRVGLAADEVERRLRSAVEEDHPYMAVWPELGSSRWLVGQVESRKFYVRFRSRGWNSFAPQLHGRIRELPNGSELLLELRTDARTLWIWRTILAIALLGSLPIAASLLVQSADVSQTIVGLAAVILAIILIPLVGRALSGRDEMELIAQVQRALANGADDPP